LGKGEMTEVVISCDPGGESNPGGLNDPGGNPRTRVISDYWESCISDLQVLVFDPRDSSVVEYRKYSGGTAVMTLMSGWEYIIYGIANSVNDFSDVTDIADLLSRTTLASNQKKGYFEMIGQTGVIMIDPSSAVRLPLERMVGKLQIDFLSMSADCDECCRRSFDIDWVAFSAVPTTCSYDFRVPDVMWQTQGIVTTDNRDISFERITEESWAEGAWEHIATYPVTIYSLPDETHSLSFARYVVVKGFGIGADDEDCWHCVSFRVPPMEHNKQYRITSLHLRSVEKVSHNLLMFQNMETRGAVDSGSLVECFEAGADYMVEVSDMTTGQIVEMYEAHY